MISSCVSQQLHPESPPTWAMWLRVWDHVSRLCLGTRTLARMQVAWPPTGHSTRPRRRWDNLWTLSGAAARPHGCCPSPSPLSSLLDARTLRSPDCCLLCQAWREDNPLPRARRNCWPWWRPASPGHAGPAPGLCPWHPPCHRAGQLLAFLLSLGGS